MSSEPDLFDGALPRDHLALEFVAPGAYDRPRPFALEVLAQLPYGARAWLEAPVTLLAALRAHSPLVRVAGDRGLLRLMPHGRWRLGPGVFPERSRNALRLLLHVPPAARARGGEIAVRQLYEDVEVGRVTFRLDTTRG